MSIGPGSGYVSEVATFGQGSGYGWDLDTRGPGSGHGWDEGTRRSGSGNVQMRKVVLDPDMFRRWPLMGRDPNLDGIWTLVGQDAETDVTWILMVRIRMWVGCGHSWARILIWLDEDIRGLGSGNGSNVDAHGQDPETDLI